MADIIALCILTYFCIGASLVLYELWRHPDSVEDFACDGTGLLAVLLIGWPVFVGVAICDWLRPR